MNLDNSQVISLAYRGLVPMRLAAGARIECTHGRIWVTQDNVPGDVVLEPGQAYEISRGGGVVVQALREARLTVRNASVPHQAARLGRLAKLFSAAARTAPAPAPSAA